ncbi:MAG: geranylgeranylglyceryl/heptaprenylglyceryl phosphate synthase [Candidatus ainarchaeum sp.]|nr:geranylgeranylglyceryl/heptaprenylglyceryl phosphate synthase [Candidatus ainarchaeum sp.]
MQSKSIQDVCPELKTNKGLALYLDADRTNIWTDPDKKYASHLEQIVKWRDCYNCIIISGSTGVTKENASKLSTKLQSLGYDKKRIGLLPPKHEVLSDNFGFVIICALLNSKNPYFKEEFTKIVKPQINELTKKGIIPIYMAYLLIEPADQLTVGKVTNPDIIGREEYDKAISYYNEAIGLGFKTISLEAGSGADQPVPEKIINIIRQKFNGIITVGGGIKTADQVYSILKAGSNLVICGDVLEKSENLEKILFELHNGVNKANNNFNKK